MANGILILDKPPDWTSHDVVAKLRGILQERRVGHGGTLDPMATGVLPVFAGRATRAVEYAADGDKEYLAGLRLGTVTDTQDITGRILDTRPACISPRELEEALSDFRGPIQQVPPMYSAIKIGGKKLYEVARKGGEIERPPRPVTIHSLTVEGQEGETDFLLRVRCSKGTYVRTLCHDIGARLGCGGTLYYLRRTRVASFGLEDCVTLEQAARAAESGELPRLLIPVDRCFAPHPALTCTPEEERRFIRNGTPYPCPKENGLYRVYNAEGDFLMLGRVSRGLMTTEKSFFSV